MTVKHKEMHFLLTGNLSIDSLSLSVYALLSEVEQPFTDELLQSV